MNLAELVPAESSLRFPSEAKGHPPSIEWITLHLVSLVGSLSVVSDIWQEPPPWVAPPMNERV